MRTLIVGLAFALAVPSVALACEGGGEETADAKPTKEVTVAEAVALQNQSPTATMYDANSPEFREQNGIVPGAKLLSSLQYDTTAELPAAKDSKLIFYCANSYCGASHMAARRAIEAGYTDVAVMPEGLMGWKKAGRPVAQVTKAATTAKPQS